MEIPISLRTARAVFLLLNYRKKIHTESLNYNSCGQYQHYSGKISDWSNKNRLEKIMNITSKPVSAHYSEGPLFRKSFKAAERA